MEIIAAVASGWGVYTHLNKDPEILETQNEYNIPFEVSNVVRDNDVEWVFINE